MTRFRVVHRTRYEYSAPVSLCHNEAHLSPRDLPTQKALRHQLLVDPLPDVQHQRKDFFGNAVTYFAVQEPHQVLEVTATSDVDLLPWAPIDLKQSPPWDEVRDKLGGKLTDETVEARPYCLESPHVPALPELGDFAAPSFPAGQPILAAVDSLMRRIHAEFSYDPHFTTIATPLAHVLEHRRGVCQDFAHLAIGALRSLGLAARYVSGYIESVPPPGAEKLVGADASHAWAAAYVPGLGWIDFDPTNNQLPPAAHVTVAWGRDYSDVTPLKGVILGGGEHHLSVSVDVSRLPDAPPAVSP